MLNFIIVHRFIQQNPWNLYQLQIDSFPIEQIMKSPINMFIFACRHICFFKTSQVSTVYAENLLADLCFFTRVERKALQNSDESKFYVHECHPHAKAVPGSIPKGHVYVRVNILLVFLTEPGRK